MIGVRIENMSNWSRFLVGSLELKMKRDLEVDKLMGRASIAARG